MKARVAPTACSGHVAIPPSKSMAHRAIICAALAQGTSVIKNVAYSQDIKSQLPVCSSWVPMFRMDEDQVTITGDSGFLNPEERGVLL